MKLHLGQPVHTEETIASLQAEVLRLQQELFTWQVSAYVSDSPTRAEIERDCAREALAAATDENDRLTAALRVERDWWACVRVFGVQCIASSAIAKRLAALTAALEGNTP